MSIAIWSPSRRTLFTALPVTRSFPVFGSITPLREVVTSASDNGIDNSAKHAQIGHDYRDDSIRTLAHRLDARFALLLFVVSPWYPQGLFWKYRLLPPGRCSLRRRCHTPTGRSTSATSWSTSRRTSGCAFSGCKDTRSISFAPTIRTARRSC